MPASASAGDNNPDSTSRIAPASAHTASGKRKGRMMTPAVAGTMIAQASKVSWAVIRTSSPAWSGILLGSDSGLRRSAQSTAAGAARFGQEGPADRKSDCRDGAEGEERSAVARLDHDKAGQRGRDRRPDALGGDDGTLRDVEASGVAHEIGDDHREDRAKNARPDAVEQLHGH